MTHYYSEKQDSPIRPTSFTSVLRGMTFKFEAGSGVFSKDHVDTGSKLLINAVEAKNGNRILDLGCGYGPVGITLSKLYSKSEIVMSDINSRAVAFAKKNSKLNQAKTSVIQSYLYEKIEGKFDLILTNPPQSAGKDICLQMMDEALPRLNDGGRFVFVARHKKGGRSLSEHLESVFGNLSILDKGSGFRVYEAIKQENKLL